MKRIICENMKIIILLSSIVLVSAASVNPSPRSVNVALETSFLFEPKDINDNISFIKNIKVFLDKLYKILAPQAKQQQLTQFRTDTNLEELQRKFAFLDWIKNVGETFVNFTGSKIEDAVSVIHVEITKVAEKGKDTIQDILPDKNIKDYVQDSVGQWARTRADDLKESIKNIMKSDNPVLTKFARRMNNYYTEDDVKKLHKILRKFTRYVENNMDASKVVKGMFQVAIFDKYKSLNETAKAHLIKDMKLLSEFVNTNKKFTFKLQGQNRQTSSTKRKNQPTIQLLFGDTIKSEEDSNHVANDGDTDLRKTEKKKPKKDDKKKGPVTNEIVVDNVELIVQSLKP